MNSSDRVEMWKENRLRRIRKKRDICDAYLAGESLREVAERFGISKTRVSVVIRDAGILGRSSSPVTPDSEFVRLHGEGMSLGQIAKQLGCSRSLVLRKLRRNGIDTRSKTQVTLDNERKSNQQFQSVQKRM